MAELTSEDLWHAVRYADNCQRRRQILHHRARFPHIFIDYSIRAARDDDYYVPQKLVGRAMVVTTTYSERGCEQMSCYPYHETGPIDRDTPYGFTALADTLQEYAQPACFNLDPERARAEDDEENYVQSAELRFYGGKCIVMDTAAKVYLNTPFIRTDEHMVRGVDDVSAFNIRPSTGDDHLMPETFDGTFNEAYCARFGRDLINGRCTQQWWETMLGFVLGDSIYTTLKLAVRPTLSSARRHDYMRPSPLLPNKPAPNGAAVLDRWLRARDPTVDEAFESLLGELEVNLKTLGVPDGDTVLRYTAERGFTMEARPARIDKPKRTGYTFVAPDRSGGAGDLSDIISQFIEDNQLIFSLLTDLGFDYLLDGFKAIMRRINVALVPQLKRAALRYTGRLTTRLLGETFKAATVRAAARYAINTVSRMAMAMARAAALAASVVGVVLLLLMAVDFIFMFWDPYGYSNMFPREFPHDLATAFLNAFYEHTSGTESRDLIEYLPEFYSEMMEVPEEEMLLSFIDMLDYISVLEVNSNGQLLDFDADASVNGEDVDEVDLTASVIASSTLYTKEDFFAYTDTMNELVFSGPTSNHALAGLALATSLLAYALSDLSYALTVIAVIFLCLAVWWMYADQLGFYARMLFIKL